MGDVLLLCEGDLGCVSGWVVEWIEKGREWLWDSGEVVLELRKRKGGWRVEHLLRVRVLL